MPEGTRQELAARVRAAIPRIVEEWTERVRSEIPSAKRTSRPALVDSLPDLLDRVAAALARGEHPRVLGQVEDVGGEHGQQRAALTDFTLDQVLFEYDVLRQVLYDVLSEPGPLDAAAVEVISHALLRSVRAAAREFTRLRDEEKRRAHLELERRVEERIAELRMSEVRFRHFVDSVKDYAIFTLDDEGNITSWNVGCARMKGYTADEALGRHFSMLYPQEGQRRDEPMDHLRAARDEGRFRGEGLRIRKSGEYYLADVSITPILEAGELAGFTKVVQDLTERNLLIQERDLSRSHAEAMRLQAEYRERFVATLTHDLRSPLSAARMAAELIARSPDRVEKVATWAHRIANAVEQTDRMISDLLDASRVEAGETLPMTLEACDLREIATELCDDLATRHGARFSVESELPVVKGVWSADGLRRVLDNLLGNAVKYGEPGTPIAVRLKPVEDRLLLAVHNHGTVIPAEEQQKLFQAFHRARTAEVSGKRGWGLGLTLVKAIVEAHGGIVKVESYITHGTTFTVDLPFDARRGAEGLG